MDGIIEQLPGVGELSAYAIGLWFLSRLIGQQQAAIVSLRGLLGQSDEKIAALERRISSQDEAVQALQDGLREERDALSLASRAVSDLTEKVSTLEFEKAELQLRLELVRREYRECLSELARHSER